MGHNQSYYALVMQFLGKDLGHYIKTFRKLSLKTVLMVADQVLEILENIHKKGILHKDLKPENIMMGFYGDKESRNVVYLIDFGIANTYEKKIKPSMMQNFVGTTRFASINAHRYIEGSPRDDLESFGYVMLYLLDGSLP